MAETANVRLARIEERLISHIEKSDERHEVLMDTLKPVAEKVAIHHDHISAMKRDRFWLYSITMAIGATASLLVRYVLH